MASDKEQAVPLAAGTAPQAPDTLAPSRQQYQAGAFVAGGVFSLWSLANIARGTNDQALWLWLMLFGSGLLCRATELKQRAHILGFALLAYSALVCLVLVFTGVALLFGNYFPCEKGPCEGGDDDVCMTPNGDVRVYPTCDSHYANWSGFQISCYRLFCACGALASLASLRLAGILTRESWKAAGQHRSNQV